MRETLITAPGHRTPRSIDECRVVEGYRSRSRDRRARLDGQQRAAQAPATVPDQERLAS